MDDTGVLVKMFTNYFQIIGVIATFRLKIPSGIKIFILFYFK